MAQTLNGKLLIPYNKKLKKYARDLRINSTLSETLVWMCLRRDQVRGYDFHRQKPIGNYIVDFFCYELLLVIEIDGTSHEYKADYDKQRLFYLKSLGLNVLIFLDSEVKENPYGVVEAVENWIDVQKHLPNPSLKEGLSN